MSKSEETITIEELQSILETMNRYNREDGYMAYNNGGKLEFYDSYPFNGGAYITKQDLINYINQYNN